MLLAFHEDDPAKLFGFAKSLFDRGIFGQCLSELHAAILSHILSLNNIELWCHFLDGKCTFLLDDPNSQQGVSLGSTVDPIFESPRLVTAFALNVRYILWEHAIDRYFSPQADSEYKLLDNSDADMVSTQLEVTQAGPPSPSVRPEDDDYDDEDKDEDVKSMEESPKLPLAPETTTKSTSLEFDADNSLILRVPPSKLPATAPPILGEQLPDQAVSPHDTASLADVPMQPVLPSHTPAIPAADCRIIRDLDKTYHSFEYDRETLIKRRRLIQSDLQFEEGKPNGQNALENGTQQKEIRSNRKSINLMGINLGAATSSLQHLLETILQRRSDVLLTDTELRSLFMDVRKNKGKWASDERIGQEELYEACEKVVVELRGCTEHSTPFLNKVSKREAPNYIHVIRTPMDLNTVMKKLKLLAYDSKQQFVDDLMLIWSNCLTYNADPKHFLRAHAIAMQKKSLKLTPTIPNIVIKNRSDVDREEDGDAKADILAEDEDTDGDITSLKIGRKRLRRGEAIANVEADPSHHPVPQPATPTSDEDHEEHFPGDVPESPADTQNDDEDVKRANNEEDEDDDDDDDDDHVEMGQIYSGDEEEFDADLQAWRSLTAKSRAKYCAQRLDLFDDKGQLRLDAAALLRIRPANQDQTSHFRAPSPDVDETRQMSDEPYLLEYDVTGITPEVRFAGLSSTQEDHEEAKLAELYLASAKGDASNIKSPFVLAKDKGLNKMYLDNITEAQEIRKICFKISLIRQMQTQQFIHHTQMKAPVIEHLEERDLDSASALPTRDPFSQQVQFSTLKRSVCKVAMLTGFESTQPSAINALTQVAERYMGNLIKSLKLHSESTTANKLSPREILLASLVENGVGKPDDLHIFVDEKISKQLDRLRALRRKLSNFLKELLRPGLKNFNEQSFEDNSEQFMTGDFSSGLGDDFFGFKELGLDKEFNMLTTSIPVNLLHSRLHNLFTSSEIINKSDKYEDLNSYEPSPLLAKDIDKQIKLLQPFYESLLAKSKSQYAKTQKRKGESCEIADEDTFVLMEDEEMPQKQRNIRPRLPPTGRILLIKKKSVLTCYFIPEDDESALLQEEPRPALGEDDDDDEEDEENEFKGSSNTYDQKTSIVHESPVPASSAVASPTNYIKSEV